MRSISFKIILKSVQISWSILPTDRLSNRQTKKQTNLSNSLLRSSRVVDMFNSWYEWGGGGGERGVRWGGG